MAKRGQQFSPQQIPTIPSDLLAKSALRQLHNPQANKNSGEFVALLEEVCVRFLNAQTALWPASGRRQMVGAGAQSGQQIGGGGSDYPQQGTEQGIDY